MLVKIIAILLLKWNVVGNKTSFSLNLVIIGVANTALLQKIISRSAGWWGEVKGMLGFCFGLRLKPGPSLTISISLNLKLIGRNVEPLKLPLCLACSIIIG